MGDSGRRQRDGLRRPDRRKSPNLRPDFANRFAVGKGVNRFSTRPISRSLRLPRPERAHGRPCAVRRRPVRIRLAYEGRQLSPTSPPGRLPARMVTSIRIPAMNATFVAWAGNQTRREIGFDSKSGRRPHGRAAIRLRNEEHRGPCPYRDPGLSRRVTLRGFVNSPSEVRTNA